MKKGNTVTITYHNVRIGDSARDICLVKLWTLLSLMVIKLTILRLYRSRMTELARHCGELDELAETAGNVKVSPNVSSAEGMVDLEVKYTASKGLAERNSKGQPLQKISTLLTVGFRLRCQLVGVLMLMATPAGMIYEKPQSDPNATSLDLDPSGGVTVRPGKDPDLTDGNGRILRRHSSCTDSYSPHGAPDPNNEARLDNSS